MSKHLLDMFILFIFLILPLINFLLLVQLVAKKDNEEIKIKK